MKRFVTKNRTIELYMYSIVDSLGTSGCGYLDMVDLFIFSNKRTFTSC